MNPDCDCHHHSFDCIVLDKQRPRCTVTKELVGLWWKKPLKVGGQQLRCDHDLLIFLVDGTYIRNVHDSDFVQGTGYNYKFIPKRELWLDQAIPQSERRHVVKHECTVAHRIAKGSDPIKAFHHARRAEEKDRVSSSLAVDHAHPRWKRSLHMTCVHGLKCFAVDGTYIRDHFDSQFIQGGNEFRYDFVPAGELWVEEAITKAERPYVLFHECHETENMRQGWSYDRAHNAAKRAENKLRRSDRPGE